ncbi:hypothetical protein BRC97_11045 [Halobacteriales archaeon QS_6_71_20]|nr:MAG: hypothetical protein BRC97_11045 [Halobacteriales archaeon QS_6_71_20]
MTETVDIPWIDEPVELAEAVELVARAGQVDEEVVEEITARVDRIERRIDALEDGSSVTCPSCESGEAVYTAGVGAAKLAAGGSLDDSNAAALDRDSHVCLDCHRAFTPTVE